MGLPPTPWTGRGGRATRASGHVLLTAAPWRDAMVFRTREAGILRVARDGEEGYRMTLPAYGPEPRPLPDIVKAVGGTPAETLWHPGRYALDRKSTRLNSSH